MKLARYTLVTGAVVVIAFFAWLLAITLLPPSMLYPGKVAQVEKYVAQLETYKKEHGEYPDEKRQNIVPLQEQDNPYFYEGGSASYRVGFRVGFDEVYFYDSGSKRWSFEDSDAPKKKGTSG